MERARFWSLVEAAKEASGGDVQRQAALLVEQLGQLPLSDIIEFHHTLETLHAESLRADLWDAAAVINQWDSSDRLFCSEDRFFIFRGWLVAQGRQVYQASIADPDSLADCPELGDDLPWGEWLWGVAMEAYTDRTGEEMPGLRGWPGQLIEEDAGSPWRSPEQVNSELRRRYPRLWARFRQH
jgi:Protein of unknown function (DUF4240)